MTSLNDLQFVIVVQVSLNCDSLDPINYWLLGQEMALCLWGRKTITRTIDHLPNFIAMTKIWSRDLEISRDLMIRGQMTWLKLNLAQITNEKPSEIFGEITYTSIYTLQQLVAKPVEFGNL